MTRSSSSDRYSPLREYIRRRGGLRVAMHGAVADRLIDQAVADWPAGCPDESLEEVVRARLAVRIRSEYGAILASFLIAVLANVIARLIVEWLKNRQGHRDLMEGWSAQARSDVQA